tara:strand:- start:126 stop:407 length:282 start_codon:yes stop_codon:yes gene_type:complete
MFFPKQCHKKKARYLVIFREARVLFLNKLLFDFKKLKSRVIGDTFVKVYVDAWKNLTGRILKVGNHTDPLIILLKSHCSFRDRCCGIVYLLNS